MDNLTTGRRILKIAPLLGLTTGLLLVSGCAPLAVQTDVEQTRLDTAAPPIAGQRTVGQTFVSRHANLSAVELLVAVHDEAAQAAGGPVLSEAEGPCRLTFHLRADGSTELAEVPASSINLASLSVDGSQLGHNTPLYLSFLPQRDSAGRAYYVRLTGRRLAGVWGLVVVGLVSIFPAYYVSWGRYTQLTGLILLPTAIVLTMDGLEAGKRSLRRLLLAAVALAGLFLTHYRVTLFAACFLGPYLLYLAPVHLLLPCAGQPGLQRAAA